MPRIYQTIRDVPAAKVGDWPVYRGNGKITREDIADIVAASQDPEIREALDGDPRGWLGHIDGADVAQARHDEPAIGRLVNLRASDDGDTLILDTEDIPEGVPEHYPRRSVELIPNVTTPSGKRYRKVLTGMAYLGRVRGAIRGLGALDDIARGQLGKRPTLAALQTDGEPILCALPDDGTDTNTPDGSLDDDAGGSTVGGMTKPTGTKPDEKPDEGAPPEGTPPEGTPKPDEVEAPEPEKAPASGPETVTVTKAVWDQTLGRLDALEKKDKTRTETDEATERDTAIAAALKGGFITPDDKGDTVAYFAEHGNAAGLAYLKGLSKGAPRVPVDEIGANAADDEPIADEFAAGEPLPDHLSIVPRRKRRGRKES